MVTAVHRDLRTGDPLASLLTRNAVTLSGDSLLRFKAGMYELAGGLGLTYIDGDAPAIARAQRSSAHYLQRPDKGYALYDPNRRSMIGGQGTLVFSRTGGRHWLWNIGTTAESPGLELNDIGKLMAADGITSDAGIQYRETQPGLTVASYF